MSSYQSDPKTAVMRQVQQEAAMQNARMLVEVRLARVLWLNGHGNNTNVSTETQRALLRTLHPQAWHVPLQRRRELHERVHGKVHERMEHSQQAIRRKDTAGECAGRGRAELVKVWLTSEGKDFVKQSQSCTSMASRHWNPGQRRMIEMYYTLYHQQEGLVWRQDWYIAKSRHLTLIS